MGAYNQGINLNPESVPITGRFGIGRCWILGSPGTTSFVVPSNVSRLRVRLWAGGSGLSNYGGGGGGFSLREFAVTSGQTIPATVGGEAQSSSFGSFLSATPGGATGASGTGIGGDINTKGGQGFQGGGGAASLLGDGGNGAGSNPPQSKASGGGGGSDDTSNSKSAGAPGMTGEPGELFYYGSPSAPTAGGNSASPPANFNLDMIGTGCGGAGPGGHGANGGGGGFKGSGGWPAGGGGKAGKGAPGLIIVEW